MVGKKGQLQHANVRTWDFAALSDIWTGDFREHNDRLITTGLLGSIHWWFEVVVRGMGGCACDPSQTDCRDRQHCVACELFGCTGWSRKFRFDVLDTEGKPQRNQITTNTRFQLSFTPLRPIHDEEWALLEVTLRLISRYGALGGKTIYKPTDEKGREGKTHHTDFGLISTKSSPIAVSLDEFSIRRYLKEPRYRRFQHKDFAWASTAHFWAVSDRCLTRETPEKSTFNQVIGRPESKTQSNGKDSWLAGFRAEGKQKSASKKVFSFKSPARTFGFCNFAEVTFDGIQKRLERAWPNLEKTEFVAGKDILHNLLKGESQDP